MPVVNVSSVSRAVALLKNGEVVVFPTETAYALGGCAVLSSTIDAIYDLKKREGDKPLALVASDIHQVEQFFYLSATQREFAQHYWPGPLTLLLRPRSRAFGKKMNKNGITLGVRVTGHPIARKLCQLVESPLVSTSANISGAGTPYSASAIARNFSKAKQNIYFINAGTLPRRATSAIVELSDDSISVLRWNPILRK